MAIVYAYLNGFFYIIDVPDLLKYEKEDFFNLWSGYIFVPINKIKIIDSVKSRSMRKFIFPQKKIFLEKNIEKYLYLSEEIIDHGDIEFGEDIVGNLIIRNKSDNIIKIKKVSSDCSCTSISFDDKNVYPMKDLFINYSITTKNPLDNNESKIIIFFEDEMHDPLFARINYNIKKPFILDPPIIKLGNLSKSDIKKSNIEVNINKSNKNSFFIKSISISDSSLKIEHTDLSILPILINIDFSKYIFKNNEFQINEKIIIDMGDHNLKEYEIPIKEIEIPIQAMILNDYYVNTESISLDRELKSNYYLIVTKSTNSKIKEDSIEFMGEEKIIKIDSIKYMNKSAIIKFTVDWFNLDRFEYLIYKIRINGDDNVLPPIKFYVI